MGDDVAQCLAIVTVLGVTIAAARSYLVWRRWRTIRDTGTTVYQYNPRTGKRRAWQRGGGYQPIDRRWVETGEWLDKAKIKPPNAAR